MTELSREWHWVRLGNNGWLPAVPLVGAANGWGNLDTWEDFHHEVSESIVIPSPRLLKEVVERLQSMQHERHEICEDCWYSCPKSQDYCGDEYASVPISERPCHCGLDTHNARLQEAINIMHGESKAVHEASGGLKGEA